MCVLSIGDALEFKGLSQTDLLLNMDILKECCDVFGNTIIFPVLPIVM